MKRLLVFSFGLFALLSVQAQHRPVYLDPQKPVEERIEDALRRMTTAEKIAMIHAQSKFSSPGVPRLGIPEVWMTDGPHGIRPEVLWDQWEQAGWSNDSCVNFPALTCLAATWDPAMAERYGRAIGEEARYRKKSVLLGPGVNIYQSPLNGRNFEYMGEDPFLASEMVVPYVQGVQENGVAACVKHYALNNHELNRHTTDVEVSDRALYEIYLPAFRAAVEKGHTWAIMGSYNLYRGQHCCHNKRLLVDILKGEWGFDGVVVSDWGGTHDTEEAIRNGLDMEFGTWTNGLSSGSSNAYDHYYLAAPYARLIAEGKVGTAELDDKVRRILRLIYRTELNPSRPYGSLCSEEHFDAARRIAEAGMVLLKNEGGLLPLPADELHRVLVVGENAVKMMSVGGGSSSLKTKYEISPLEGLRRRLQGVEVIYARGYVGDTGGSYNGVQSGQQLKEDRTPDELIAEAVAEAKKADCVIFVGGLNKSKHQDCEDSDRTALDLPYDQNRVIEALAAANPRLVVVNVSGNAVAMPWLGRVKSVVQAWYAGSEGGTALAAVLTGDTNPSGRLPFTFPARLEDVGAIATGQYPGTKRHDGIHEETYADDLFVGYRWFDRKKIVPLFPFGHGLSYTTFRYGKANLDRNRFSGDGKLTLSVPVTNTGDRAGDEVVQLYIRDVESTLIRPEKELKGFSKVHLEPGETKTATFTIDRSMLAFFDDAQHAWVAEPGRFEAIVAASATDIRTRISFYYDK